jgi:hypothetical protein
MRQCKGETVTIDRVAIQYRACSAGKECSKCYQFEMIDGIDDSPAPYCHQYDMKTQKGMVCGLFGSGKPKAITGKTEETKNEPTLF